MSREDEEAEQDPRRVGAVLLTSFFPGAEYLHPTDLEQRVAHVAVGWQQLSAYATLIEVAGANTNQAPGRMSEIFARIASSGEQLMLAGTCLRDARRWNTSISSELASSVATRGLTEMANYFALSAAHGLANTTLRLLLLHPISRMVVNTAYPRARGFDPFTDNPQVDRGEPRHGRNTCHRRYRATRGGDPDGEASRAARRRRPVGSVDGSALG